MRYILFVTAIVVAAFTYASGQAQEPSLEKGKIEVLAGANLPSLIKLIDIRAKLPLDQAVKEAIEAGRKYMRAGSADLG